VTIDGQCSSSSRKKRRTAARLGFGLGSTGAHLGQLSDDLAAVFGCGGSDELGDAAGEVNVDAARSWACSFTSRCSGVGGDDVGYSQT
jgi:hypothetical protein